VLSFVKCVHRLVKCVDRAQTFTSYHSNPKYIHISSWSHIHIIPSYHKYIIPL